MNCDQAYQELEALGVKVGAVRFNSTVALSGPEGYLAIDYSRLDDGAHELEVLLHEIGHFQTGSFYQLDTPYADRKKQEAKATRYVFEKFYPAETVARLMAQGRQQPWAIAEALGLPEDFVVEMLAFYKEVKQVDFEALARQTEEHEALRANEEPQAKEIPAPQSQEGVSALLDDAWKTRGIHMQLTGQATPQAIAQDIRLLDRLVPDPGSLRDETPSAFEQAIKDLQKEREKIWAGLAAGL